MFEKVDLFTIPGYHICLMNEGDAEELQMLLEKCADYSLQVDGYPPRPSAAILLISDRPEGKAVEDKVVIGIFSKGNELVGVLDAIRDYPRDDDCWIGLLLIEPDYRKRGLGRIVVQSFKDWLRQRGVKFIFLGVVEENEEAYRFWRSVGFTEISRQPPRQFGNKTHVVITLMHELAQVGND